VKRAVNDEMSGCGLSMARTKVLLRLRGGRSGLDVANATRPRLLTHIFGALDEADRTTLLRLLDRLDEAASHVSHLGNSSLCHP
jgi:hypothetical protein